MINEILEQLYVRYYKSAFLYTLSLCNNRELAEDIVEDAFIKAYLTLSDKHASFQYWILRVCKNLWIDYLRRQKRNVEDGEKALLDIADDKTPEQYLLQDERLSMLYRYIRLLPAVDREILILHYFAKLPLHEIAQVLQATPGSIKTRLCRARQRVKHLMEENDYEF